MKLKRIIIFLLLVVLMFMLPGCSFFSSEETALEIVSIENEITSDGRTKITITYSDETKEPDVFYIAQGAEGVGIKSIVTSKDEDSSSTNITITYTDGEKTPVSFKIPHGTSIIGVSTWMIRMVICIWL